MKIPYGNSYIEFENEAAAVLCSSVDRLRSDESGSDIVRRAMDSPIDSPPLRELAGGKSECVIIISDHTRPVPSRDIIPNMLRELREGSPDIRVTLLVATGFHRGTSVKELEAKLGRDIMEQVDIRVHDCRDPDSNVQIGILPSGAPCVIDKLAAETELLIAEGFIEPHFFAGFSGGRKSVLPGVCDKVTVLGNHCSRFIDDPHARTGVLDGNPLHTDMLAAAEMAGLKYIVNVIIDEDKKTVAAFAGNYVTAHRTGCDFLLDYCRVAPAPADIVITSNGGSPLDRDLYQCVKGMTAAEASCVEGGTIIMCADCCDGHGGEGFYRTLSECESPAELYRRLMAIPWNETVPDQWESQILARILMHHRVIVITRPEMKKIVEDMKMIYAPDLDTALKKADYSDSRKITVIPKLVASYIAQLPMLRPQVGTIRPGTFRHEPTGRREHIEFIDECIDFDEEKIRTKLLKFEPLAQEDGSIADADVVVCVGNGLSSPDKLSKYAELAALLNGQLACTRPVFDRGMMDFRRIIGQSGAMIKPKLYIGFGVSGAINHVAGFAGTKMSVAVNSDPDAAIFNYCDYGIVGDMDEVCEAMIKLLKAE